MSGNAALIKLSKYFNENVQLDNYGNKINAEELNTVAFEKEKTVTEYQNTTSKYFSKNNNFSGQNQIIATQKMEKNPLKLKLLSIYNNKQLYSDFTTIKGLKDIEIKDPKHCPLCPKSQTSSQEFYEVYFPSELPYWSPPKSPHNLIEESLYHDPWALLVATIFLNKTSCKVARKYLQEFLEKYTSPYMVLEKNSMEFVPYFEKLGLHNKRAEQIWKMSHDFIHKKWKNVGELFGVGRYGEEAYRMFCLGDLSFEPQDRFLRIYRQWYKLNFSKEENEVFEQY